MHGMDGALTPPATLFVAPPAVPRESRPNPSNSRILALAQDDPALSRAQPGIVPALVTLGPAGGQAQALPEPDMTVQDAQGVCRNAYHQAIRKVVERDCPQDGELRNLPKLTWDEWHQLGLREDVDMEALLRVIDSNTLERLAAGIEGAEGIIQPERAVTMARKIARDGKGKQL